ncbi:MAG: DUF1565 domain-containing protein [Betaproteobacteria bacterium]|nr:DUF1565 domain-containing protein [Betaproteobacteria bacterium]
MGEIRDQFSYVYRDFETDGIPSSGLHEVEKADVRALAGVIEDEVAVYAAAAAASAAQAVQAAADAQGGAYTLTSSVSAGGSLPFEISAITGGGGTGGTPGFYLGTTTGGSFQGFVWGVQVGTDGKALPVVLERGISPNNTAPTLVMPTIAGLTGATTPTATVVALPAGRLFFAPNASSGATHRLAWQSASGVIAAFNIGGVQWSEYLKAGVDAQAAKPDAYGASRAGFNLWTDAELEYVTPGGTYAWGAASFSVITENNATRIRNPSNASVTEYPTATSLYIPISALPSGKLSASVILSSKPAGALGDQRFRLYARNAALTLVSNTSMWGTVDGYGYANDEPSTGRWARLLPAAAITRPTEIVICQGLDTAALIAQGVAWIELRLRTATSAQIAFSHIVFRDGNDPHFVPTRVSPKQVADNTTAANRADSRTSARLAYSWSKNLVADPYLASAGATVTGPAWTATLNVVSKSGMACVEIPANGSTAANKRWLTFLDVSSIPSGTPFSLSVTIAEKAGTTDANTRIRIYAFDSGGAAVPIGGTTIPGNDMTSDATAYNRYIPNAAISTPTPVVIWEGISLPAGITRLAFDVRQQSNPAIYLTGFVARIGNDAAGQPPASGTASGMQVAYVSATGSDSNTGSVSSPLRTIQAAITALGGNGIVEIAQGDYGSEQRFDPTTVIGKIKLRGRRSANPTYDKYPIIRMGTKLTGITKVGGYTKVYKASVTGLSVTNATYSHIWQDGVADPRTVIADADRSPQHRGRTNRLKDCARILKCAATTVSTACAEIDAASLPLGFVDNATGDFYFSIVGGGDATAANIYVDAATGLVNSAPGISSQDRGGEIEIQALEVRYGGVVLTPFKLAHVHELVAIGARANVVDYAMAAIANIETAGGGSMSADTGTGDGINGHYGAKLVHVGSLYSHDNLDDGFSDHEGCSSRLIGTGLFEYNGGTAIAPAYGSDHLTSGLYVSRRNQQVPGRKVAAFAVIGAPSGASPYEDDGYDTLAVFEGCISIGDTRGFSDGGTVTSKAIAINCKVYDLRGDDPGGVNRGYDGNMELRDCGFSSSAGTAKGPSVTVKNTALVT